MKEITVSLGQAVSASKAVLPVRVQEALGELVGAAKEGLLALSVGVGLGVLAELMEGVPPNWSTVFAVADTDETMSRAQEPGGTVLMGPIDLPEIGRPAVIRDPAGAVFQVLAPPAA